MSVLFQQLPYVFSLVIVRLQICFCSLQVLHVPPCLSVTSSSYLEGMLFLCALLVSSPCVLQMDLVVKLSTPDAIYGVWIVHSEWIDLLPRHTIILDQSHCTNATHARTSQLSPPSTLYNTPPTNTLRCSQPTSHQGLRKQLKGYIA